jgi:hypothetical protein
VECARAAKSQGLISFFAINAALERASAQLHDIRAVVDTNSRQIAGMLALPRRESLVRLPSPRGVVCATRDEKTHSRL